MIYHKPLTLHFNLSYRLAPLVCFRQHYKLKRRKAGYSALQSSPIVRLTDKPVNLPEAFSTTSEKPQIAYAPNEQRDTVEALA